MAQPPAGDPLSSTPSSVYSSKLPPVVQRLRESKKDDDKPLPICVLVVGMAGSGKTTLMSQMHRSSEANSKSAYCLNLDPATLLVPYPANIDIRDTVDYTQVMKQHNLGPNGAIMTSLNLFCTKFDQVMQILEKRAGYQETTTPEREQQRQEEKDTAADTPASAKEDSASGGDSAADATSPVMDYILVDTPGQIEAFTWSASGTIMAESLASSFPTVLCFVVDTVRCASSPNTFMSNMLYACSMLFKTRLPLVVCFNKTDVVSHLVCLEWMRDYDVFQEALDQDQSTNPSGFYGSLTRSLSLVLEEFYRSFVHACGVSSVTGEGMDEFWTTVQAAAGDFETDYVQDLQNRIEEQQAKQRAMAQDSAKRLQRDLSDKK